MNEKHPQQTPTLLTEIILHTVEKNVTRRQVNPNSEEQRQLTVEVDQIFTDRESALNALKRLFPEGILPAAAFFDRLSDLHHRLGWGEMSDRATGLFLLLAVNQLHESAGEALLNEMPRIRSPRFFQTLETLSVLTSELIMRSAFAAEWFPSLLHRIGNDMASAAFWRGLGVYCEKQPEAALDVLDILTLGHTEEQISVAAYILGAVRSLELTKSSSAKLTHLESKIISGDTAPEKEIYNRSWVQTAFRGKILKKNLILLTTRFSQYSSSEKEQSFWIICHSILSPAISPDCFDFGLEWLRKNASGVLGPNAKYAIVDFTTRLPISRRNEAGQLILQIQPVLAEHKGIWLRLEHFLVLWLQADLPGFCDFCLELANLNAGNWLEVLKSPQSFELFKSELRARDAAGLVGKLIVSKSSKCRVLGLFLFDELEMKTLPSNALSDSGPIGIKIAFYEFQRGIIRGHAIARFLISLLPFVKSTDDAFQEEFYAELVRQLKNYGGVCREEFKNKANELPLLQKALKEAESHFNALHKIQHSSINSMEVAGYRRAERMYTRKFSNEVSKQAEEMSVFMSFVKKVRLLYGKSWSTFHDGHIGQTSGLQQLSSSFEIPRLEMIEPEAMAILRFYAASRLLELSSKNEPEKKA